MSDNYSFAVRGEGPILRYLEVLLHKHGEPYPMDANGYLVDEHEGAPRLVFFTYNYEEANKLPVDMEPRQLAPFIEQWLSKTDYPAKPDIDGDCKKGWLLTNGNRWGDVDGYDYHSVFSVQPDWQLYGK